MADEIEKNKSLADDEDSTSKSQDPEGQSLTNVKDRIEKHEIDIEIIKNFLNLFKNKAEDTLKDFDQNFTKRVKKIKEDFESKLKKQEEKTENRIRTSELRSVEIIGIISTGIALVLVFVNTANVQTSLEVSFFVLITATSALVIFASLIHYFFNTEDKNSYKYYIASLFF